MSYESLFYGCPVLCSDRTPWDKLEEFNAGWNFSLNNSVGIKVKIEALLNGDSTSHQKYIEGCKSYINYLQTIASKKKNQNLFNI